MGHAPRLLDAIGMNLAALARSLRGDVEDELALAGWPWNSPLSFLIDFCVAVEEDAAFWE